MHRWGRLVPGVRAAEVHDAEEWAPGEGDCSGKMGVQPSLHASAVLGLSLIPCVRQLLPEQDC